MWDSKLIDDSYERVLSTNDVDEIGMVIKKRWNLAGEYQIVLRVADEDKKNPGVKELTIVVVDDESGLLDTVSSQVIGPDASIIVQIMLGLLGLLLLAFVIGRLRPKQDQETWIDDDEAAIEGGMDPTLLSGEPMHSPPEYAFQNPVQSIPAPEPIIASQEPVLVSPETVAQNPVATENVPSMAGLLDELDI